MKFLTLVLVILVQFFVVSVPKAYAATSPTLSALTGYSVLGGGSITNVPTTTTNGDIGVSPGTSLGGGYAGTGTTHSNDASAIAAQAEALTTFGTLNQTCDHSYGAQDLTLISPLTPGVYCSTSSFSLSGNLTLTGSGVWIFKTVSTLITSTGSSVTGGDPCNVWWRIGSSTTLETTTSFIGTVISQTGENAMKTKATLNGRFLALSGATVTLDQNTISGPTCTSSSTTSSSSSNSGGSFAPAAKICPGFSCVTPVVLESKRVSPTSIFLSWGPYAGQKTFVVYYGPTNGNWLYNTTVTGFSTTINLLPANQPVWVLVQPTDSCSVGTCGVAQFVGGPSLPNTGFAPNSCSPMRLVIPAIDVNTNIQNLGVTLKGALEVPNNAVDAGWFDLGPRPGERGSAVIAGHFDGKNGEAGVFTNLDKLKPGDMLYVKDDKGVSTAFVVRGSRTYDPGYAEEVFSTNDGSHLNLITCDGVWDGVKKSYTKRLVVFADIAHNDN